MKIIIAGNGKMAEAIKNKCAKEKISFEDFSTIKNSIIEPNKTVAIHIGSGREFKDLVNFCDKNKIPIIQGSTNFDYKINKNKKITIIDAPNLSIPMIRFMSAFIPFAKSISKNMDIKITESHQSEKKDVSGTARKILKELKIPRIKIDSIRDKKSQLAIGVPKENLDGHAYHEICFNGEGVEIKISTKILGRDTYAKGAIFLVKTLTSKSTGLGFGKYEVGDILKLLS